MYVTKLKQSKYQMEYKPDVFWLLQTYFDTFENEQRFVALSIGGRKSVLECP